MKKRRKQQIKRRLLLCGIIFITFIVVIITVIQWKNREKKDSHRQYVTVRECVSSINLLFDEQIIQIESYQKPDKKVTYREIAEMFKIFNKGDNSVLKKSNKYVTRAEWYDILVNICADNGMSDICQERCIGVYDIDKEKQMIISDDGTYIYSECSEDMTDKAVTALVRDDKIIFVKHMNDTVEYENVLIVRSEQDIIYVQLQGIEKSYRIKGLRETLEGVMADICIRKNAVWELQLKRDSISGKVLSVRAEGSDTEPYIEIEGFGKVALSPKARVYTAYNQYREGNIQDIAPGNTGLQFIVAEKQICGIFIKEKPVSDNIRVLLKSSGYKDIFHDRVTVTSYGAYQVIYYENDMNGNPQEVKQEHPAEEVVEIGSDNPVLSSSRIKIVPNDENGKIIVSSISRNGTSPAYRGTIEVSADSSGRLVVINELPLEEYLYAVVPSEMPSSYGVEALKVQAVCARSYAISHMNNGKLSQYGAQVDDSTDYQVYNSTPETENAISAVNATYGEVLQYGEEIANTYFYATSCGSTTGGEIWGGSPVPYLKGKILSQTPKEIDLTDNEQFTKFIKEDYETYDSASAWYRWTVKMTTEELTNAVNNNLDRIYQMSPDNVLTLKDNAYESVPVSSVGSVTDISVERRGEGGIIEELLIKGNQATVKILKQSAIRNLLNPNGIAIIKKDGTSVDTFTAFPSAFFTVEKTEGGFTFYGGGYGHGAGMSQTAVKGMIDSGMNYEEILQFFYTDVHIEMAYGT